MSTLFFNKSDFNEDIVYWDTTEVTSMNNMFRSATAFNQDLSGWNVSLIEDKPTDFDTGATSWAEQSHRPKWGTDGSATASTHDPALLALVLYPNPVTNTMYVQSSLASELTYHIYDLRGKALSSHNQSGQSHSIDLSGLAKGIYFLKATHLNNTTAMQFVKQ